MRSASIRFLYAVIGSAALHGLVLAGLDRYSGMFPGRAGGVAAQPTPLLQVGFHVLEQPAAPRPTPAPAIPAGAALPAGEEAGISSATIPFLFPGYFSLRELDRRPLPLRPIRPVADEEKAAGVREGQVTLRLLINERGEVDKVFVLESDPAGAFEDSALEAFSKARFRPGEHRGAPVKSQVVIRVRYSRIPEPDFPPPSSLTEGGGRDQR